jgi:hypothetical protein
LWSGSIRLRWLSTPIRRRCCDQADQSHHQVDLKRIHHTLPAAVVLQCVISSKKRSNNGKMVTCLDDPIMALLSKVVMLNNDRENSDTNSVIAD